MLTKKDADDVTLAIRPGTWIKRGDQLLTIDELGVGNYVKVQATQMLGEPSPRLTQVDIEAGD